MEESELNAQKTIQFYGASVNAWFNTALEHDKSILALSAAGIGLLITLLTTTGLASAEALLLYVGAIVSFLLSIICVLFIFNRNKAYIEEVVTGSKKGSDPFLTKLDLAALGAFGAGVVFSVLIGLSAGINSYTQGKQAMTEKKIAQEQHALNESFNNLARLQSPADVSKSFNNVARLQPEVSPAVTPPAEQPAAPAPQPPATQSDNAE
jgi:hypothetical protein